MVHAVLSRGYCDKKLTKGLSCTKAYVQWNRKDPNCSQRACRLSPEMDLYLWTAFLLFFFVFPCDAEQRVKLTGVIGSSVTFPDPVKERAFLLFGPKAIAFVSKGVFEIEEDIYTNRLHWSSSGLFTLSHLQKNDSGVYTISNKKGNVFSKYYELKLYEAVPAPVVSSVNVSADSCTLQCSVTHTELTTLSWFRGEQPVVSCSSEVLPLTVQRWNYTSQYKCVAQNTVDRKTAVVNITTVCTYKQTESALQIIIPIVFTALIIIIILCVVGYRFKRKHSEGESVQSQDLISCFRKT